MIVSHGPATRHLHAEECCKPILVLSQDVIQMKSTSRVSWERHSWESHSWESHSWGESHSWASHSWESHMSHRTDQPSNIYGQFVIVCAACAGFPISINGILGRPSCCMFRYCCKARDCIPCASSNILNRSLVERKQLFAESRVLLTWPCLLCV